MSDILGRGIRLRLKWGCTVRLNASWVMVIWDPPVDRMMGKHD